MLWTLTLIVKLQFSANNSFQKQSALTERQDRHLIARLSYQVTKSSTTLSLSEPPLAGAHCSHDGSAGQKQLPLRVLADCLPLIKAGCVCGYVPGVCVWVGGGILLCVRAPAPAHLAHVADSDVQPCPARGGSSHRPPLSLPSPWLLALATRTLVLPAARQAGLARRGV